MLSNCINVFPHLNYIDLGGNWNVIDFEDFEKIIIKARKLIDKNINFLIMDEPTNHIDITTKEVLESALKDFPGTILFISHDRYFINELAQKILYIEDKKIKEYLGNYDYFKEQKIKKLLPPGTNFF